MISLMQHNLLQGKKWFLESVSLKKHFSVDFC